ncbi:hypothetical protein PAXRUDRAFT_778260 [Paxillus rubicundulus Ve08.2h10]|uniref:Uncharacterized protein n=1 Tax=Paxillus rubicundulus Ve08.2h10 TaxID=930991 RepID=A0A0D0DRA2_9AGAM|nr:hypothetical protein PAXRUDRAFT_778260 [Paxillus rubicundulus Ve08.2h10]
MTDQPPHNIAEKINHGYKVWEFWLFLYAISAVLYGHLPDWVWEYYHKLVQAVCIVLQHTITLGKVHVADQLFLDLRDCIVSTAEDMGGGYALLKFQDHMAHTTTVQEGWAIYEYVEQHYPDSEPHHQLLPNGTIHVVHWACIRLPNGQIGCCQWKEEQHKDACKACNVQLKLNGTRQFGKVCYFIEC